MEDRISLRSPRLLRLGCSIAGYEIRKVLGVSAYGVTYKAYDKKLNSDVAIREYFPEFCAQRDENNHVRPVTREQERKFDLGCTSFLNAAKALRRVDHDNIIKVLKIFGKFNTIYMVMEYEVGDSLDSIFKQNPNLKQRHQAHIFFPIIDGLKKVHELGYIHCGISPSNILIRENGKPVLIGFGSARQLPVRQDIYQAEPAHQCYMPLEQYSVEHGEQGAWTDIYSIAATMYQSITGWKPDEVLNRSYCKLSAQLDTIEELSASLYPAYQQEFLSALHAGLSLQPGLRPQNLANWQALFDGGSEDHEGLSKATRNESNDNRTRALPVKVNSSNEYSGIIEYPNGVEQPRNHRAIGVVSIITIAILGIFLYSQNNDSKQISFSDNSNFAMPDTSTKYAANQIINPKNTSESPHISAGLHPEISPEISPEINPEIKPEIGLEANLKINLDKRTKVSANESQVFSADSRPETGQGVTQDKSLDTLADDPVSAANVVRSVMSRETCSNRLEVLSRTGEIYFKSGSAKLEPASIALLTAVIDVTERCPQFNLEVSGHTDSTGDEIGNQILSELRAKSVAKYLTDNGVATSRVIAKGYGEARPIYVNNTVRNRAQNRRIEFTIAN